MENSNRNSVNGENNDILLPLLLRWKGRKLVDILVVVDEAEDDVGGQVKNAAVVVAILLLLLLDCCSTRRRLVPTMTAACLLAVAQYGVKNIDIIAIIKTEDVVIVFNENVVGRWRIFLVAFVVEEILDITTADDEMNNEDDDEEDVAGDDVYTIWNIGFVLT